MSQKKKEEIKREEREISLRKYNLTHEKKQEERNKKSKELDEMNRRTLPALA